MIIALLLSAIAFTVTDAIKYNDLVDSPTKQCEESDAND
jgi:hypothetical protein